jgi:hypothetical protein
VIYLLKIIFLVLLQCTNYCVGQSNIFLASASFMASYTNELKFFLKHIRQSFSVN